MKLSLKVVPGSSQNTVVGWLGEDLKVKVTAIAESGKANKAVIATLANALKLPKQSISIIAGNTHCNKTVEITDLCQESLTKRLNDIGIHA